MWGVGGYARCEHQYNYRDGNNRNHEFDDAHKRHPSFGGFGFDRLPLRQKHLDKDYNTENFFGNKKTPVIGSFFVLYGNLSAIC